MKKNKEEIALKEFSFPAHNQVIKAQNAQEAVKKLKSLTKKSNG